MAEFILVLASHTSSLGPTPAMEPNSLRLPETAKMSPSMLGREASVPDPRVLVPQRLAKDAAQRTRTFVRHTRVQGRAAEAGDAGSGQRLQQSKTGSEAAPRLVSSDEHSNSTEHLKDAEAKETQETRAGSGHQRRPVWRTPYMKARQRQVSKSRRCAGLECSAETALFYESHQRPIFGMLLAL
ncbi:hypothetical protein TgHK011_005644 [Trichoderma gracile]|nr:hypothetical protein TgHK011_005644 [Trichoderma gracile]